ncbi:hypothetical protein TraAM80_04388 [Trypanosoma rangeli]|uniref:Uncharacterized protein n=1 Tax=Trypanosoma rangeli TaxID=5698 RepID=A0A422NJV3_TRYRA|nr:uncharacterized protein TraAM80_04388 [Trypanosoma rangeli]RNF05762.1 hypothetical protein TraAM80_04388 [Trypanosoma rangeli]|eukprot:RNF05762.1 hypothetical protein TraAM80_04388 [Trypanosoma rangeli]
MSGSARTVCPHRAASQRLLHLEAISLFLKGEEGDPARVMPCPASGEGRAQHRGVALGRLSGVSPYTPLGATQSVHAYCGNSDRQSAGRCPVGGEAASRH